MHTIAIRGTPARADRWKARSDAKKAPSTSVRVSESDSTCVGGPLHKSITFQYYESTTIQ